MSEQENKDKIVHELRMSNWERLAAAELPAMLRSCSDAIQQLKHQSPKVRQVAIQVLTSHWKAGSSCSVSTL
jgi:hypothetical protein